MHSFRQYHELPLALVGMAESSRSIPPCVTIRVRGYCDKPHASSEGLLCCNFLWKIFQERMPGNGNIINNLSKKA